MLYNLKVKKILENIFDSELDQHYREFTEDETKIYIQELRKLNSKRFRSNYLKALFEALYRGVDEQKIFFAECTASELMAKIQHMASSILLPHSGVIAVGPLIDWLYKKLTQNTSLEALHIMGVFISRKEKLFVFVNDKENEYWNDDKIFSILLHELCHMCAYIYSDLFHKLFYDKYILPFFKTYFQTISKKFNVNATEEDINFFAEKYSTELLKAEKTRNVDSFNKVLRILNERNKKLTETCLYVLNKMIDDDPHIEKMLNEILFYCYHQSGMKIPRIFNFYQEILFPSEIVCVVSLIYNKRPEFIQMLNSMFM